MKAKKFPKEIYVFNDFADGEYLPVVEKNLDDVPDDAGEVAFYELKYVKKIKVVRSYI